MVPGKLEDQQNNIQGISIHRAKVSTGFNSLFCVYSMIPVR